MTKTGGHRKMKAAVFCGLIIMRNFKCVFKFLKFTNLNNEKYKKITRQNRLGP